MARNAGPLAPRLLVLGIALSGMVAGTFCAPATPPAAEAPPAPVSSLTASEQGTAAVVAPPPASTAAAAPASASASAKLPAASAPASAALPLPKLTFPQKPVPVAPSHGGKSWAVFLVLGPHTPERTALTEAWWAALKDNISRGMGCHEGAGAPGQDEPYVAVYFKTEKDAKAFAAGTSPPPVRIAHVKTFCMD